MAHCPDHRGILSEADRPNGKILGLALPLARNIVLKRYGHSVEAAETCPGEAACVKWASAKGSTHAAKERNVCKPCSMFPTKSLAGQQQSNSLTTLIERAIDVRRHRVAGYPRHKGQIGHLVFQTYLIVDELIEDEDVLLRQQLPQILMAGFKLERN